ncbi:Ig-like domain-containing protein [bacterium]|nr:Ig-like domain-containing protein [bacterium]
MLNCAKVGAPPGGPRDDKPPQVIETNPINRSTFIPVNQALTIVFDEWVNRTSFESAFTISPRVSGLKYSWHRKKVEIEHLEILNDNTTYIITLGTMLEDLRGNSLLKPFSFAFSTGGAVDSNYLEGTVYMEGKPKAEARVYAYQFSSEDGFGIDSLPRYISWTGKDGKFKFNFLPTDSFRIIALLDNDGNRLISPGSDQIGLPSRDLRSTAPPAVFNLVLFDFDTLEPRLLYRNVPDKYKLDLKFSKAIDHRYIPEAKCEISGISPSGYSPPYLIDPENQTLEITFYKPLTPDSYRCSIKGLFDLSGKPIVLDTLKFDMVNVEDSLKPKILEIDPAHKENTVYPSISLKAVFSEALKDARIILLDSLGIAVEGSSSLTQPNVVIFRPERLLEERQNYKWRLENVADYAGNISKDTTLFSFRTLSMDTFGILTGKIISPVYPLNLEILNIVTDKVTLIIAEDSLLGISLFPGRYLINSYIDNDRNGHFSPGNLFPFAFAEPFWALADTFSIRSRWETRIHYDLTE